jgi:hypothetical protein
MCLFPRHNQSITHGPNNDAPASVREEPFSITENMISQIIFLCQPNRAGLALYPYAIVNPLLKE